MQWLLSLFEDRTFGATRSSRWPEVEKTYLLGHPTCAVCGKGKNLLNPLNVHHKTPFHTDPAKELDFSNLITLCRRDHFLIGHLLSWKSWNVDVEVDAANLLTKITNRP